MTEYAKAKAWRVKRGWTQGELGELLGFSRESIYWFERGLTPPGNNGPRPKTIKTWVWLRYKNACHGVEANLIRRPKFNW